MQRKQTKTRLWTQNLSEVVRNPYDYENQSLFLKEAKFVLDEVYRHYDKYLLKFSVDDRTKAKAIWMLHLDALDTLRDCIYLLDKKKHRTVGKLFRDVTEVLDLAALFWSEPDDNPKYLNKWYKDEVVPHRVFRDHLNATKGESFRKYSATMYDSLSKWTHHCYSRLLNSYSIGGFGANMLVYDSHSELLVLPQTLSQYSWEIKDLILYFLSNIKMVGLIKWKRLVPSLNRTIHGMKFS